MKVGIDVIVPPIEVRGRFHSPNAMLPMSSIVSFTSFENNVIVMGTLLGLSVLYCNEYPV